MPWASARPRSCSRARVRRPLCGARAHLGRIGAEERRRDRDRLAGHEREVEREMMALEAPAPGRRGRIRRAEHRDRVVLGIAQEPAERLELAQHALEADHVDGLGVADRREARLHQLVGRGPRGRGHRLEGQALAAARDVVPVEALLVGEGEDGAPPRIVGQRGEKRRRRAGHRRARGVGDLGEGGPRRRPGRGRHRRRPCRRRRRRGPHHAYFTVQP